MHDKSNLERQCPKISLLSSRTLIGFDIYHSGSLIRQKIELGKLVGVSGDPEFHAGLARRIAELFAGWQIGKAEFWRAPICLNLTIEAVASSFITLVRI